MNKECMEVISKLVDDAVGDCRYCDNITTCDNVGTASVCAVAFDKRSEQRVLDLRFISAADSSSGFDSIP